MTFPRFQFFSVFPFALWILAIVSPNVTAAAEETSSRSEADAVDSITLTSHPDDRLLICGSNFSGGNSNPMRIGGDGAGKNLNAMLIFELPAIEPGLKVQSAQISVFVTQVLVKEDQTADAYGIGWSPEPTLESLIEHADFFDNVGSLGYTSDQDDAQAVKVADGLLNGQTVAGQRQTTDESTGHDLARWINDQYRFGAEPGDYVFLRLNPAFAPHTRDVGWSIRAGNHDSPDDTKPWLKLSFGPTSE